MEDHPYGTTYESLGARQEKLLTDLEARFNSLKAELRKSIPFPANLLLMGYVAVATEARLCWGARRD